MRKKSIWLVIGLLVATLLFAVAGCKTKTDYKLGETEISLTVGEEKQLTISPDPTAEVSWETDDAGVATVTNGLVLAVGAGRATVSAKIEGVENPLTCTVTVSEEQTEVNGYRLDFSSVSLKTGETLQISVVNEEGQTAQATYSSADPAIATVSESGLITAVGNGETLVRAKIEGGTLVCKVTVAQAYTYSLDKTTLDIAVGAGGKLTLITTPGGSATNRPHTFSSSNESVVTVAGGTGKLTGVAKGTATITCLVDGQELTATVNVIEYTVRIGEEVLGDETTLLLGEDYNITVESDPARDVSATYSSSNDQVVSVSGDGKITIKKLGTATISVSVGGKTFTTTVTVESDYKINYTQYKLNLGATDGSNTVELAVESKSGAASPSVTYTTSDSGVATVDTNGVVTATGMGTATITATVTEEIVFETTITVVPDSALTYQDYTYQSGAINLTYLDANKTIDWRQYYGDVVAGRMANNVDLIGDVDYLGNGSESFWDYKAPVLYEDGNNAKVFGAYTYGKAVHGSYQIPVRVTNAVTKLVILTGSWKETGTVQFKLGDTVLQEDTFVGGENALARKYELSINLASLNAGDMLDMTIVVNCPREHGGNVSLVAVAVVGNEAHAHAVTASTTGSVTESPSGSQNLSTAGSFDWLSATGARKAGVLENSIIDESGIQYNPNKGNANDYPTATISWNNSDGTENAPTGGSRAFHWADNRVSIPVLLYKGTSTVTIYATGWNCGYLVAAYDGYGNFVGGYQGADEHKDQSVSSKIVFNMTVEETGVYAFKIMKCRGAGNSGWAAIAVSSTSNVKPTTLQYNLVKGGNDEATVALTNAPANLTFVSGNTAIVTVDENGKITAVDKGNTFVTISDGTTERRVFVTVTEYTLTSDASLTLAMGETSQIAIGADPDSAFTVSYSSSDEAIATVDAEGRITAVTAGNATITATVGGKSFTIAVKVEAYLLSHTDITLHAGKNTNETETLVVSDDSGNPLGGIVFNSSNEQVATVDESTGVITAVGVGTATITAHVKGAALTCAVTVIIPDATSELIELDMAFENLSRVSSEYKTIDYKHWNSGATVEMDGRETLIGEPDSMGGNFWDYKTAIGYEFNKNARNHLLNLGMCYGKTSNGFELPVTVNKLVSEIVFYTGAYKGTATVTFKLGDRVLATKSFTADEGIARKIVLKLDTDAMLTSDTLTIVGSIEKTEGSGNINVVAVAVVGKTPYSEGEIVAATGTASAQKVEGTNLVDLTEVGSLDWIYSHYENPKEPHYQKIGGTVFTTQTYYDGNKGTTDGGREWDGRTAFKWTNGKRSDLTEVPEDTTNPKDNDTTEGYTNNYNTSAGEIHIAMHLAAGKYEVKVYLNSWKADICSAIYDGNNNFVVGKLMICHEPGDGSGWVVTYTLDVKAESTFNLVVGKSRSHDASGRQVGWQAVAVAEINA